MKASVNDTKFRWFDEESLEQQRQVNSGRESIQVMK